MRLSYKVGYDLYGETYYELEVPDVANPTQSELLDLIEKYESDRELIETKDYELDEEDACRQIVWVEVMPPACGLSDGAAWQTPIPLQRATTKKTVRDPLDDLDFEWERNHAFKDGVSWHEARGNYYWQINAVHGHGGFHYLVRDIYDRTWVEGTAVTFGDAEETIHGFLVAG